MKTYIYIFRGILNMNPIFYDELKCIATSLAAKAVNTAVYSGNEINIIADEHSLAGYLAGFFSSLTVKDESITVNVIIGSRCNNAHLYDEINKEFDKKVNLFMSFKDYIAKEHKSATRRFYYFANLQLSEYENEEYLNAKISDIEYWLTASNDCKGSFVFVPVFNFAKPHEGGVMSVAEREVQALSLIQGDFVQGEMLNKLEEACKEKLKKNKQSIKIIRFDNVFGPLVKDTSKLNIDEAINDLVQNNKITIKKSDSLVFYTGCYIREAVEAIVFVDLKGKTGNIYNASNYSFTIHDIKDYLYKSFIKKNPQRYFIDDAPVGVALEKGYEGLSNLKIKSLGWTRVTPLQDAIYRTALVKTDEEYVGDFYVNIYQGKLERVKRIEMEIMREIDRICRENDIGYFLVGGSLLGAIRHKGFIPWDDDIDIGMLREDYEKFRKLCPKLLASHLSYQSYTDEPTSHYIFDKVRLKDTYFSTKFSNRFRNIENGLFVDILVYDRTANSNFMQKVHINTIRFFRRLINIRWVGKARRGIHYTASKIFLPVMKKVPFPVYHKFFERALRMFNFKKNSKYLIDGVGQNLEKGAFPAEWFEELIDVQYEDMVFKAPKAYDDYLRHWYGPNYMQLLPLSSRNSGHALSRFDLGKYLYDDNGDQPYHEIALQGEIYEKPAEEAESTTESYDSFYDELSFIQAQMSGFKFKPAVFNNCEINIIGDEHSISAYLAGYYMFARSKPSQAAINVIFEGKCRNKELYNSIIEEYGYNSDFNTFRSIDEFYSSTKGGNGKRVFYYIANLQNPEYTDEAFVEEKKKNLKLWLAKTRNGKDTFVFVPIFNFSSPFDKGIAAVSEREVEAVVNYEKNFYQGRLLMQFEDICRKSFAKMGGQLKIVRFDNIFGPFVKCTGKIGIDEIIDTLITENKIQMLSSDSLVHYTGCYIREAVSAVHGVAVKGVNGNIYNAANYNFTIHDIKNIIYESFIGTNPQVEYINDVVDMPQEKLYECLSNLKIKNIGWKVPVTLEEAVQKTAYSKLDLSGSDFAFEKIYNGKLQKIRELELEIVKHVDKICKDNNIEYFLTGSTLLGAARNGHFVPWEDAIEIGMLREDYEKFTAVCPKALSSKLQYQSYKNDLDIKFVYDRIKLKDTSLSSSKKAKGNSHDNGVFVKIYVYDKTANAKNAKAVHKNTILTLRRIIKAYRLKTAQPGPHYRITKLALPFIKLMPIKFYYGLLDSALKKYDNKADSEYLIDGVGEKLKKGAFPLIWFKQFTDISFEGLTFKAPKKYHEFLTKMYGKKYNHITPAAKRKSGRVILQVDLGDYLFDETAEVSERQLSGKGELYDEN